MANYKVFETEDLWLEYRKDKFTSSEIHKLLTDPTAKELKAGEVLSKGAKSYIKTKVANQLSVTLPNFYNAAMQRGKEIEPQAVLAFAELKGLDVNDNNFIYTSANGIVLFENIEFDICGTPDIVLKDAICEIKCPESKTHLDYLLLSTSDDILENMPEYYAQMQLNMFLTDTKLCHFISYDDRFNDAKLQLKIIDVPIHISFIETMISKIQYAIDYKNKIYKTLTN
jgi:hypothetical protein